MWGTRRSEERKREPGRIGEGNEEGGGNGGGTNRGGVLATRRPPFSFLLNGGGVLATRRPPIILSVSNGGRVILHAAPRFFPFRMGVV